MFGRSVGGIVLQIDVRLGRAQIQRNFKDAVPVVAVQRIKYVIRPVQRKIVRIEIAGRVIERSVANREIKKRSIRRPR